MLKTEYNQTVDTLRMAYKHLGWQRWFFPAKLAAAIMNMPPLIESSPSSYTPEHMNNIMNAYIKASWLAKRLFNCLRVFKKSTLFRDWIEHGNITANLKVDGYPIVRRITQDLPDKITLLVEGILLSPQKGISGFLHHEDQTALSSTSRHFEGLFKKMREKRILKKLLKHVAHGEQDLAEKILKSRPDLLTLKDNITDYSGRTFMNVSPWEYMLWALDTRYMGSMMLDCIPKGSIGKAIKSKLAAQSQAMQGGGNDLLKLGNDVNPICMNISELIESFEHPQSLWCINHDAILYWKTSLFYVNKKNQMIQPIIMPSEDVIFPADRDVFANLIYDFRQMPDNSSRKSTDKEYEVILRILGYRLERKGLHYKQPAKAKPFLKLDGSSDPRDKDFASMAICFDTKEALIFWNNQFFYANKVNNAIIPLIPIPFLPASELRALEALKLSLTGMKDNESRLPGTQEEHQLINFLFGEHYAFKPTHHCDSHYNFAVINILEIYADYFPRLNKLQRDALWINKVAKAQQELPAHILQHYCDPDVAFYPLPNFKAKEFKRKKQFYNWVAEQELNLLLDVSFHPDFGFQFGLIRGGGLGPGMLNFGPLESGERLGIMAMDSGALLELYKVRIADSQQIQYQLCPLVESNEVLHYSHGLGSP